MTDVTVKSGYADRSVFTHRAQQQIWEESMRGNHLWQHHRVLLNAVLSALLLTFAAFSCADDKAATTLKVVTLAAPSWASVATDGGAMEGAFVDINLPNGNGLSILQRMRSTPEHHPPVLILLTCGDLTDVVQARQLGANSYLQKAIDFQHITSRLQQELEHWLAQAG